MNIETLLTRRSGWHVNEEASRLQNSDIASEARGQNVHSLSSIALSFSVIIVLKPLHGVL